jgi:uncharacterized protein with PQ loop repeat
MVTVEAVGWAGTLSGTLLGLPQAMRLARTRNVEGLSLRTWQALLAVNVAWTQHGLRIGQPPQIITSVLSLCSTVPILILMSRELRRPPLRDMLPGLLAAAGMISVDRAFGTAAYGIVAVIPAVLANAGQGVELVRAPRIVGVSPLFLLLAAVNQALWHLGLVDPRRRHRDHRRRHRGRRRVQPRLVAGAAGRAPTHVRPCPAPAGRGPPALS